jgi:hypothetical protein
MVTSVGLSGCGETETMRQGTWDGVGKSCCEVSL